MKENFKVTDKWVPYEELRQFFNYKATQMASLLKNELLKVAQIGKRKFVERESIERLLEASSKI